MQIIKSVHSHTHIVVNGMRAKKKILTWRDIKSSISCLSKRSRGDMITVLKELQFSFKREKKLYTQDSFNVAENSFKLKPDKFKSEIRHNFF